MYIPVASPRVVEVGKCTTYGPKWVIRCTGRVVVDNGKHAETMREMVARISGADQVALLPGESRAHCAECPDGVTVRALEILNFGGCKRCGFDTDQVGDRWCVGCLGVREIREAVKGRGFNLADLSHRHSCRRCGEKGAYHFPTDEGMNHILCVKCGEDTIAVP